MIVHTDRYDSAPRISREGFRTFAFEQFGPQVLAERDPGEYWDAIVARGCDPLYESAFGIPVWVLKMLHMASLKMATHVASMAERYKIVHAVVRPITIYMVHIQNRFAIRRLRRSAIVTTMRIPLPYRFSQCRSQSLCRFSAFDGTHDIHALSGTEPGISMGAIIAILLKRCTAMFAIENAFRTISDAAGRTKFPGATQMAGLPLSIFRVLPQLFRLRSSWHLSLPCLNLADKGIILW